MYRNIEREVRTFINLDQEVTPHGTPTPPPFPYPKPLASGRRHLKAGFISARGPAAAGASRSQPPHAFRRFLFFELFRMYIIALCWRHNMQVDCIIAVTSYFGIHEATSFTF